MTEKYKVLPDSNGKWCIVSESPAGMFCFHVHERFDDKDQAERICHLMNRNEGAKLHPRLHGDDWQVGDESPEPLVGDIEASVTVTPPAGLGLPPFEIRWGEIPAAPDNIAFCTPAAVGKSEQLSGDFIVEELLSVESQSHEFLTPLRPKTIKVSPRIDKYTAIDNPPVTHIHEDAAPEYSDKCLWEYKLRDERDKARARIAELEAEVELYRDKERRKAYAEKLRDWNLRREYATNKWISADRARIHKEAQRRGWKGGVPAEPYVPKELVEKIRRVYGYLKRRADRDFLRANPMPVLEPTP